MSDLEFIEKILYDSGNYAGKMFGENLKIRKKEEKSQIVTEVDITIEKEVIKQIRKSYANSSVISEEIGLVDINPDDIWILDPIDGTSNFVNNLPWYGIMIAHLVDKEVVSSGIYLPFTDEMYLSEHKKGAFKNKKRFKNDKKIELKTSLICFGSDGTNDHFDLGKKSNVFQKLMPEVLNIRSTNSALDYAYSAEGRFAGCINFENKIWDVAPISLIAKEAGCIFKDVYGNDIFLDTNSNCLKKNYSIFFSNPTIFNEASKIISMEV